MILSSKPNLAIEGLVRNSVNSKVHEKINNPKGITSYGRVIKASLNIVVGNLVFNAKI